MYRCTIINPHGTNVKQKALKDPQLRTPLGPREGWGPVTARRPVLLLTSVMRVSKSPTSTERPRGRRGAISQYGGTRLLWGFLHAQFESLMPWAAGPPLLLLLLLAVLLPAPSCLTHQEQDPTLPAERQYLHLLHSLQSPAASAAPWRGAPGASAEGLTS